MMGVAYLVPRNERITFPSIYVVNYLTGFLAIFFKFQPSLKCLKKTIKL
jgi:hypothetical protein